MKNGERIVSPIMDMERRVFLFDYCGERRCDVAVKLELVGRRMVILLKYP